MRRLTLAAVVVALLIGTAWTWAAGPGGLRQPPRVVAMHQAEAAARQAAFDKARLAKSWVPALGPSPIDVIHYDLDLQLDLDRTVLSGTVQVELAAVSDNLSTVSLDADQALRVLSVILVSDESYPHDGPCALAFTHQDDQLSIPLPRALRTGERIRLLVSYGGQAGREGYGVNWDLHGTGSWVISTEAEPFGSRMWWPCNDRPDDKATVDLTVTAPASLVLASNGLQVDRVENGDGTATTHWSSRYPIATYLVVMNLSDYVYSEEDYTALDGSTMPVVLYAYPELATQAQSDLANTPEIISVYAHHYGEYPFLAEKFGNCLTPFGGGMEHQTLTTFSAYAVGSSDAEWLNTHELAHEWWGDWLTCSDWKDVWLNEGFATYSEQLWSEHEGPAALAQYVENSDWLGYYVGPVYDNAVPFSTTIYDKGGWVLRMLRHVLGDDVFFAGLAAFRAQYGGAGATTEQLRAVMESTSGTELGWFFDEWVYGVNRPTFQYSWSATAGPAVHLVVTQKQTNSTLYRMPLDVRVATSAGTVDTVVWVEAQAEQTFDISVPATPNAVALDPDHFVLCEMGPASDPDLDFGPLYPDRLGPGTVVLGTPATFTAPLTNIGGSELVITSITPLYGTGFEVVSPTEMPIRVAPGTTAELQIRFSPRSFGTTGELFEVLSNDPSRGGYAYLRTTATVLVWPQQYLIVAPARLDFGPTPVGGASHRFLVARNGGAQELALSGALTGEGFTLTSPIPESLAPGEEVEIGVRFAPAATGAATGALVLSSNDPFVPHLTVSLSGEGQAAPRLVVEPGAALLGVVSQPTTTAVTLTNAGQAALTISELTADAPFDLPNPPSLPLQLEPGGSADLDVRLTPGDPGEVRGALRILSDDPSLPWATVPLAGLVVASEPDLWAFPAVARTAGIGGADWVSDVVVLNPTATELDLDLTMLPEDGSAPDLSLSVPPGQQRVVSDVVTAIGRSGAGGLEVTSSGSGLVATSLTYTTEAAGTYGQQIGAVPNGRALSCGGQAFLAGLAGNGGFHTNLGLTNLGDAPLAVDFQLFAVNGQPLGTVTLQAPARGFAQRSDVLTALTDQTIRGGWAVVSCVGAGTAFDPYASVVDDTSHDPTFIAPALPGAGIALEAMLPAVASNPGLNDTHWRSELTVVNTATTAAEVSLELHPRGGGEPATATLAVPARAAVHVDDVVADPLGRTGSGWLRLSSPAPGLVVATRTYNDDPSGTYGQDVPAVPTSALFGAADTVVLPALRSDAGFRTNLGIASAAVVETTVHATARRDDGTVIGELDIDVPASALVQVDQLLDERLGYTGRAWVTLTCGDSGASYAAYASVVDGQTGDPVFIPGLAITQK